MSKNSFNYRKILEVIDLLDIGEVTTYGDIAKLLGREKAAKALGRFITNSRNIPPCDAARVIHSRKDSTGNFNVTNNTDFDSYYGVDLREVALTAAGVRTYPGKSKNKIKVRSDKVIKSEELGKRYAERFDSR